MNKPIGQTNAIGFECQVCPRCSGTGQYSYNQIDGSRCFKCGGAKIVLTKRGQAARTFFIASQQRILSEIQVGEFVWDQSPGKKAKWLKVLGIRKTGTCVVSKNDAGQEVRNYFVEIETQRDCIGALPGSVVRSVRNDDELQAQIRAALGYQATLTAHGKPIQTGFANDAERASFEARR